MNQNTTSKQAYPVGFIHGRFQVLHNDHMAYLLAGKGLCEHLIIGVTNPDPMLTKAETAAPERHAPLSNPLTYYERQTLIRAAFQEAGVPERQFTLTPFPVNFPELFQFYAPMDAVFFLTIYDEWGRKKLQRFTDMGLRTHVLWERPPEQKGISAVDVRKNMAAQAPWEHMTPPAVAALLRKWDIPARIRALQS